MTCEVHDGEKQVAELLLLRGLGGGFGELGQFLVNLAERTGFVGPVEAGPRGAALQLDCTLERRKRKGDARQRALVVRGATLLRLERFPTR